MSATAEAATDLGLSELSTDSLTQLARALSTGTLRAPVGAAGLQHAGLGHLKVPLEPFKALDTHALGMVIKAVLAERSHGDKSTLDLVWSGSDAGVSYARYTKIVIPELIAGAKHHVTIAGYSFDQGAGVFELLHQAIVERAVHVRFFLDIHQLQARLEQQLGKERRKSRLAPLKSAKTAGPEAYGHSVVSLFLDLHWPFEGPKPELFYDPRTADPKSYASLHAKCLIVDHERSLITSANFTDRGQTRNIEVGVLIHDKGYATAVERQWSNLIESGGVVRA
ncbi:MAG: DISARM system phospholipase D-like protein DrmC [Polyangiaceae bacterium]